MKRRALLSGLAIVLFALPAAAAPARKAKGKPAPTCVGKGEGPSQDPALEQAVHLHLQALAEGSIGKLEASAATEADWNERVAIAAQVDPAIAKGMRGIAKLEPHVKNGRVAVERSLREALNSAKELGFQWSAIEIVGIERFDQCKNGVLEGAGKVAFRANGAAYHLWIEDLKKLSRGWLAGVIKTPTAKP
jgi:hypothetical protein